MDYRKYCDLRKHRNDLAEKILSYRSLHREFVNELSRENFISFKNIESQINYGKARTELAKTPSDHELRKQGLDPERRSQMSLYAGLITIVEKSLEAMSADIGSRGDVTKHRHYGNYLELLAQKNECGRAIAEDLSSYEKHFSKYGITRESLEKEYGDRDANKSENKISEVVIADRPS